MRKSSRHTVTVAVAIVVETAAAARARTRFIGIVGTAVFGVANAVKIGVVRVVRRAGVAGVGNTVVILVVLAQAEYKSTPCRVACLLIQEFT